jgi:hypothetical protein
VAAKTRGCETFALTSELRREPDARQGLVRCFFGTCARFGSCSVRKPSNIQWAAQHRVGKTRHLGTPDLPLQASKVNVSVSR